MKIHAFDFFVANLDQCSIVIFFFLQLDIKYLSPLLLAYEDRINEKDALLQTTEVKCVYVRNSF